MYKQGSLPRNSPVLGHIPCRHTRDLSHAAICSPHIPLHPSPAVVVSYALSALTAMLTAFCYAEYAAELPVAGGAFNYVSMTFGEFAAWWV